MIVSKLTLRNFRNHTYLELDFSKGLNIIVGDNAEGKTNIVEAIHFLSLARSFRTNESVDLISKSRQFATIEARVEQDTTKKEIRAVLTPSSKKITSNGKPVRRISELSSLINVIVFEPKDALMFNDSPLVRRNFIDVSLSKKSPLYLEALMSYEKLLKERNSLLKEDKVDLLQLEVVTKQIVDVSETIVKYRVAYVNEINNVLSKIVSTIKGEKEEAHLVYNPFVKCDSKFKEAALRAYARSQESDIKRKVTQVGIHREDISMMLNGEDVATHGSQGENRLVVIALKLSPYFLIEDKEERPVVVLDDVMSELDKAHQERLTTFLRKFEQVFITSTKTNVKNASIYEVKEHKVIRRNA
ncbi:MAG: DNA replication/repair protein RecF [Bacilli bacterium]|nr:DNA replication/repair protein RecF [Bacilli bacterium]